MPNQWYPPRNREESPSKRWQTTMRSQLDEVAQQLQGNYNTNGRVQALRDRKLANTKTSISFGNDKVCNYVFSRLRFRWIFYYFVLMIFILLAKLYLGLS